nr:hypothetical transcript [Hymenolepis microstoma]
MDQDNSENEGSTAELSPPCEVLTTDEVGVEQPQQIATPEVLLGEESVNAFCVHCGKVVKTVTELVPEDAEHAPAFRRCLIR